MTAFFNPSGAPGFLIRRLQQISISIFEESTADANISTVQYGALQVIERDPGIDQVRLSQGIDTDRTTITRVADRLFKLGLITRKPNPHDRRSNSLRITRKGVELLRTFEVAADASQSRLMSPLSASEQAEFMRMLRILVFSHSTSRSKRPEQGEEGQESEQGGETASEGQSTQRRRATYDKA